jgi:hypothetical protein
MAEVICTKCKVSKKVTDFYKDTRRKNGITSWCRECWKIQEAIRREKLGPKGRKNRKLKNLYGINIEQYQAMLKEQSNLCAVCGNKESMVNSKSNKVQKLCVDHNHTTGKVRGLLCTACNKGLGMLKDNPDIVLSGYNYLMKYEEEIDGEQEKPKA